MSQIGYFGKDIKFKVSRKQVCTFDNFNQKLSSRWSESTPIGRKPVSEFNGPGLRSISFTMILDASLGVKPLEMLRKLRRIVGLGLVSYLVIGKSRVGFHKFRITSISEEWDTVLKGGELARAKVDVTMEEYVSYTSTKKKTSKTKGTGSTKIIKYTVKKGDTLWDLAKKYLGKGTLYTKIYNKNKTVIEATAKKHRKSSSDNGHWIYPGTVLEIEVAT